MRHHSNRFSDGFSLIELVLAMLLIAILSTVAYPYYHTYVVRAKRLEAQAQLLQAAAWIERISAQRNSFVVDASGNTMSNSSLTSAGLGQSPAVGTAIYNITFSQTPTATTYALQAVPVDPNFDPSCGTSTLDQFSKRGSIVQGNPLSTAQTLKCWGG